RSSSGVDLGTPAPRYPPSTQSMPTSRKVGVSGKYGRRSGVATARMRVLPFCATASDEYDIAPSTCPPRRDESRSPVPLNATYVVEIPAALFRRACAAWLAE